MNMLWSFAPDCLTSHSGERRNLTDGNAEPGNSTNWTPGSALPSVAFAGVTNTPELPNGSANPVFSGHEATLRISPRQPQEWDALHRRNLESRPAYLAAQE